MFRYTLVLLAAFGAASSAWAGSWGDAMFEDLSKDFGAVPRGPTLTHPFRLTNNTNNTVHIASVRVSCGCVSASALQDTLAPGQTTAIQAHMDTRRFTGPKSVTIFVQFDQPQWEEVRLWVQANGRDDINVSPESFNLGQAARGSSPTGSVDVTLYGGGQWQIDGVQRETNYIQASVKELSRDANQVTYRVTATVRPDLPAGKWFTDLWVRTNNPSLPRVRVPLNVEIGAPLSISPTSVTLGQVKSGSETERRIIIRGAKPFRITKIEGTDDEISVQDNADDSKPVHILTIRLKPTRVGEISHRLKVVTDLKEDGQIEFEAKGQAIQ
jgi:hypothetical protein